MGNTEFYRKIQEENPSITWKDILEESFARRPKGAFEKALLVIKPASEGDLWAGWNRPWLWWVFAKYGLALVFLLYALFYMGNFFLEGGISMSLGYMVMIIPPIIIPFVLLVMLWELNVPRDISFFELLGYFVVGGILSFAINSLMFKVFPSGLPAYYAAVREEPAKLGASVLILLYMERVQKKKIRGITGLVVGAAVGAAFSGFESISYAINTSSDARVMIDTQILRSLLALGGHITYCLPYATAMALKSKGGKLTLKGLLSPMTICSFLFAVMLHAIWNGSGSDFIPIFIVLGSVFILLYWVRAALHDLVCWHPELRVPEPVGGHEWLELHVRSTSLAGTRWETRGEPIVIGRDRSSCRICFPEGTKGVSRQHCRVVRMKGEWFLQDLESTFGTYVSGGRLRPYESYSLKSGETIYLGSQQVCIQVKIYVS